jgi:hypothetical protein
MILETLNRIRSKNTAGKKKSGQTGLEAEDEGDGGLGDMGSGYTSSPSQQSTKSSNATFGSPSTPPSSRSAKRYSNNLFGSGRNRDFTVTRSLTTRTSRSTTSSMIGTEGGSTFSDRPITPDSSGATSSAQSTPEKASLVRSASLAAPGPYGDQSNLSKTLAPSGLKRASLAFEDAIKSMALIEEEEEEILMPRTPFNRAPSRSPNTTVRPNRLFLLSSAHCCPYDVLRSLSFHLSLLLDHHLLQSKQEPRYHQEKWNPNADLRYQRVVLGLFLPHHDYQATYQACHDL